MKSIARITVLVAFTISQSVYAAVAPVLERTLPAATTFEMTDAHCDALIALGNRAIADKRRGVTYSAHVRKYFTDFLPPAGDDQKLFLDITPYGLEIAYEYYHTSFDDPSIYVAVVRKGCIDALGTPAQ